MYSEWSDQELCAESQWDQEKYGIGIKHIDEQHRILFGLVTQLSHLYKFVLERHGEHASFRGTKRRGQQKRHFDSAFQRGSQISGAVDEIVSYAAKYLSAEDHLLESYGYHERQQHQLEHDAFTRELFRVHKLIEDADAELSDIRRLLIFLKTWIDEHIPKSDRKYAPFLLEKGVGG